MRRPSPHDEIINQKPTPEDFERQCARTPKERAEEMALIDWFMRRYPTAEARLAWARRIELAIRAWTKEQPR